MRPELAALPVCFRMAAPSPLHAAQDSSLMSAQPCSWPDSLQTWQQMRWGVGWPSRDPGVFPLMSQRSTGPLGGLQPEPTPCRPQQPESCKEGQRCEVSQASGRGALWHRAGVSGPEQDAMGNVCLGGLDGISVDETVTQALGHQRVLGLLLEEGP